MLDASTTHASSAWLISAAPSALVTAIILVLLVLLRGQLVAALRQIQLRMLGHSAAIDPALLWLPNLIDPGRAALLVSAAMLGVAAILSLVLPIPFALLLGIPATVALLWAGLAYAKARYIHALDRDLTTAVGRLSALLKSGSGFRSAIERIIRDMPTCPLRDEWAFLLTRQGANLATGSIATPQQVVAALSLQTLSPRHATLLSHLSVAVGQPQDVLARRCEAAYSAIQDSDRRREEAATELAQMRYSGIAVGLAGVLMAIYLTATQWERVLIAYQTPLGIIVGILVISALLLPIIGGFVLARADDVDY
ncbi:hypothetical protein OSCT_0686 [Oscillochloris trichoides DG-6]|uniref:Type II secretion system protein n=1 Tax=Oscillochloris trichoides DG-6 TaxID=765420 RepID=E1IBI5_9CHLR|nr:hypothetical protein [Oscillochloris trichoides]EFO81404.1 hypothetical protein OSCT_0686 [Oscillochloris trichoides DG-6]